MDVVFGLFPPFSGEQSFFILICYTGWASHRGGTTSLSLALASAACHSHWPLPLGALAQVVGQNLWVHAITVGHYELCCGPQLHCMACRVTMNCGAPPEPWLGQPS